MKHIFYRLLLLPLLLAAWGAQAQAPAWLSASGVPTSSAFATATNAAGDIFVTGSFNGTVTFATGVSVTSAGDEDVYVAKWSATTNNWVWAVRGGGTAADQGNGIAVNGTSVYVTGFFNSGAAATFGSLSTTFAGAGGQDVFVAKFVDGGSSVSTSSVVSAGGASGDQGRAIAVSGSNVYVTGYVNGTASFGGVALTPAYGLQDMYVAKYTDAAGTLTYNSAVRGGGANIDRGNGIAVNGTNVYVAGDFRSLTATFGSTNLTNTNTDSNNLSYDAFVAKFTDSGTLAHATAVAIGGNSANSNSPIENANGIAVNGTSLYVTGTFNSLSVSFGNSVTLTNSDNTGVNSDMYLAKYTDGGTLTANMATKSANTGFDAGLAIAASGTTIYVGGNYGNSVTYGPSTLTSTGGQDVFVAKYTDAGSSFTANGAVAGGGTLDESVSGLAINGTQAIVAGYLNPSTSTTIGATTIAAGNGGFIARVGAAPTTVVSIVRASANPTNAATVNYTVTFGAPVTGLTASNFTLTPSGISGATVGTPVSTGTGSTWTVPVNTGTGSGTLTLNLATATGLTPGISTTLPFAGETYSIDKTAPTVAINSTAGTSGSTTATTPVPFTVTFSESVTSFVQGDLTVTGGTISGFSGSGTTYTFNVTPTSSGTTVQVSVAANVAQDAAGNGNTATSSTYSITYQQPVVATTRTVVVQLDATGAGTLQANSGTTGVNNGSTGAGTLTYTIQKIVYGRVAEGSTLTLTTPSGANFTAIRFASYGTPTNDANGNYRPGSCNAANSVTTAQNSFIGRSTGSMDATNGSSANNSPTLGDPCSGTPKALAVQAAYSADAASLSYTCAEAGRTQYVLLTVTDGSGSTSTAVAQVTVNASPTASISSVTPSAAPRGTTVTVSGSNLGGAGSTVTVNGASATVSNLTASGFTFVVPTAATTGAGSLTVTAPCSQTLTSAFTVQQPQTATPSLTAPVNNSTTNGTPVFAGSAAPNALITFYLNGQNVGTIPADGSGSFTVQVGSTLPSGAYTLYVTAQVSGQSVSNNSTTINFTVDNTQPSVVISSAAGTSGSTTTTTPIPFTVTFSESVTGFVQADLTVTGGTVSGFSGSGTTYTFNVTPTSSGTTVTVNVPANVAQDAVGNFNTAAASAYSITYNQPTATVTAVTGQTPTPTATAQVSYLVTFSSAVSGLGTSNFTLTPTGSVSGASVVSVTGSGTTYTVVVNTGTGDGTLRLNVNNSTGVTPTITNVPYTSGTTYTITKSFAAAPTLRIQAAGSASGNSDVTAFVDVVQVLQGGSAVANALQNTSFESNNVSPTSYLYSPSVVASPWSFGTQGGVSRNSSGFGSTAYSGDAVTFLQSAGGSNGSVSQNLAVPTGSYQVSFQTAQRNYTSLDQMVNVFVNNVFVGSIQPPNTAAYQTFTSATFSVTAPALTATVSTTSGSPTSTSPIPFSVSFSQSVGTTFTASDVTVTGGTLNTGSFSGSGSGPYTFTVTPSGTGTVSVGLATGVANDANNTQNTASNTVSVQYNQPATAAPVITSPANNSFTNQDVTISGTAPANSQVVLYLSQNGGAFQPATPFSATASGTFSIGPLTFPDGTYQVYATAQSSGASVSPNSATITFTVDTTAPTVTLNSSTVASGNSTSTSPVLFTATFSEAVTSFTSAGILVSGGSVTSGPTAGSGNTYTFQVTPTGTGTVAVRVLAGAARDLATNNNTASSSYSFTFTAPTITVAPATATLPGGTQGTAYSVTFSASGGSGSYTYAISGTPPSGLSLSGSTLSGTPTASGTFNFRITATDNSGAPGPYSGFRDYAISIAAPAVTAVGWNGSVSTDWFTAGNWTPNQVPDATIDAVVPTVPSGNRFPVITTGTANVRNVSIAIGAALSMSGGTLNVAANLTNNGAFNGFTGSGTTATGGTVVVGGSALSLLNGGGNNRFWNLTVGSSGTQLNNTNSTSVQRLLTLNGNFATQSNPFTLESSTMGTALVVNNGGVVNGTATVQRYLDPSLNAGLGYRHYSSPVVSTTVGDLATSTFAPVVNPAYNTVGNTVTPFPTVFGYDEGRVNSTNATTQGFDQGFFSPSALSDQLTVGRGYTVNIDAASKVDLVGALNNGTVGVGSLTRGTEANSGWHLLGNPYPAPLDWNVARTGLPTGVIDAVYVFKSSAQYAGTYQFYQNGFGTLPGGLIGSMQGFFVRVSQTVSSFNFLNTWRSTTYANPTFNRTTTDTRPSVQLDLVTAQGQRDAAFVYFEQGATDGIDDHYDAAKLPNTTGLNLSSVAMSTNLAVNGYPVLGTSQRVVPLAVGVPTPGAYSLSAAQLLNLSTVPVYLRDLQTGAVIDLAHQPSYSFTVSNASALITGRFELVFSPQGVLATAPAALAQQVGLYPNPAKGSAFVELPASIGRQAVTATLVDAVGRVVRTLTLPAQGAVAHQLDLRELPTGVYALRLSTSAGTVVKKLTVE